VGFDITDYLLIRCLHSSGSGERIGELFLDFKKGYDSVMREVFYNMLVECGVLMKPVRLIKMCLNGTYKVHIAKHLSGMFPIQNGLNAFQLCFRMCHQEGPRKTGGTEIEWDTSASGLC
jgi:hypothetical protein